MPLGEHRHISTKDLHKGANGKGLTLPRPIPYLLVVEAIGRYFISLYNKCLDSAIGQQMDLDIWPVKHLPQLSPMIPYWGTEPNLINSRKEVKLNFKKS